MHWSSRAPHIYIDHIDHHLIKCLNIMQDLMCRQLRYEQSLRNTPLRHDFIIWFSLHSQPVLNKSNVLQFRQIMNLTHSWQHERFPNIRLPFPRKIDSYHLISYFYLFAPPSPKYPNELMKNATDKRHHPWKCIRNHSEIYFSPTMFTFSWTRLIE